VKYIICHCFVDERFVFSRQEPRPETILKEMGGSRFLSLYDNGKRPEAENKNINDRL